MGDGKWVARLIQGAARTARAGASTYAAYNAPPPLRKRGKAGCTPCAAMAAVDQAKKAAGTQPVSE